IGKGFFRYVDEIVFTEMEHHAYFVPWQMVCEDNNLDFKVAAVKDNGELDVDYLLALVTAKTKMLAITLCSNVLGTIN
ncbi:aminotransferase class V-fold PLP-dependent enzyme, partial [Francisella tularensis subsp. holarctica]|uniref:aminotransferase class V-fold PLP-dependent enzyme n=1 Tax=Francisella tularensis TaxID=263 RepID=UPI00238198C2